MVGMMPFRPQPHRPAARRTARACPGVAQQRMLRSSWRELSDVALDGADDRTAEMANDGIDPAEKRTVGLRSAAHRLVEILALRDVERPQSVGEDVQGRKRVRKVDRPHKPLVAFQPLRTRVSRQTPRGRRIGPEFRALVPLQLAIDQGHRGPDLRRRGAGVGPASGQAPLSTCAGASPNKAARIGLRVELRGVNALVDCEFGGVDPRRPRSPDNLFKRCRTRRGGAAHSTASPKAVARSGSEREQLPARKSPRSIGPE